MKKSHLENTSLLICEFMLFIFIKCMIAFDIQNKALSGFRTSSKRPSPGYNATWTDVDRKEAVNSTAHFKLFWCSNPFIFLFINCGFFSTIDSLIVRRSIPWSL